MFFLFGAGGKTKRHIKSGKGFLSEVGLQRRFTRKRAGNKYKFRTGAKGCQAGKVQTGARL